MDLELIQTLVNMMNENALTELEVEEDGVKVRLTKSKDVIEKVVTLPAPVVTAVLPQGVIEAVPGVAAPAVAAADPSLHKVVSPLVGTFYRASSPEAAPFVDVGDTVEEDTVLALVEAMKVFNEIKAECRGTVEEALIDSGEAVEFGQPMFAIRLAD